MTICCFLLCSAAFRRRHVIGGFGETSNRLRALLSPFVNREAHGRVGKARAPDKAPAIAGMGVLSAWRAPMKPVLAAAICLMLGSSSFSSRGVAGPVQPALRPVHQVVLAGDTIPVLTGWNATLALVIVK